MPQRRAGSNSTAGLPLRARRCTLKLLPLPILLLCWLGFTKAQRPINDRRLQMNSDNVWWCAVHAPGMRCTRSGGCAASTDCAWPTSADSTRAVMLSDRLEHAINVTLRSACSFETEDPIHLIFISSQPQRNLPARYRACWLLPMLAAEVVGALQSLGFAPLRVCTLNESSPLLLPRATLLPRTGTAGHNVKHAMCLNHLRFYLGEMPILREAARVILMDDDIVVRRSLRVLHALPLRAGMLVAANCDAFQWSRPCIGWSVSHENYSLWFQRSEHGMAAADWAPLGAAVQAAGLPPPDHAHFVWNFGCTLFNLKAHRRLGMAATFERVAGQLLADATVRVDTLLYGLGVAYLVYQGRVQCFDSSARTSKDAWYQLDGLGHIPHHELRELVGMERIDRAAILHYTGERKPWAAQTRFAEYMHLLPVQARSSLPPPLELVLLAHDGASSDVALNISRGLQDEPRGCGSFVTFRDRRVEHHPDALLPYGKRQCIRLNRTSKRCARNGWAYLAAPLGTCQLRELCSWQSIYAASRAASLPPGVDRAVLLDWQNWAAGRNATTLFEGFLRRVTRRETSAPPLPCLCPTASAFAFFRLPFDQLASPSTLPLPLISPPTLREGGMGGASKDWSCCAGSSCALVSKATSWCSGMTSEGACHHSRTEGRPCVWMGSACTKGHRFGAGEEPRCPAPEGYERIVTSSASAASAPEAAAATSSASWRQRNKSRRALAALASASSSERVSHFDPRLASSVDFVDLRSVLARMNARVVYFEEGGGSASPSDAAYGRLVASITPRVRIERRRCLQSLAACKDDVAAALDLRLGGARPALSNDAL